MAKLEEIFERDLDLSRRLVRAAGRADAKVAPLVIAQAAFHRQANYDATVQDSPDGHYGSWIENQTVLHHLLNFSTVIVDLLHCETEEQFRAKYGVSPAQLSTLARSGFVRLTIRDGIDAGTDPSELRKHKAADDSTIMGNIVADLDLDHVMIGPVLRGGIFTAIGGGLSLDEAFAEYLPHAIEQIGALANCTHEQRGCDWYKRAATRDGELPNPRALAFRVAYHRCYRNAVSGSDIGYEAIDRLLTGELGSGEVGLTNIASGIKYASLFHHRDTAPLTGAWGGQYTMRADEHDDMRSHLLDEDERRIADAEFDAYLKDVIVADVGDIVDRRGLRFRTEANILDAERFQAFLEYLRRQDEEGVAEAKAKLRKAVSSASELHKLEASAAAYLQVTQASLERRQRWFVRFAEDGPLFDYSIGAAKAGAAAASSGASLSVAAIAPLATQKKNAIVRFLSARAGFKQAHRDIYDSIEKIRGTKL